MTQNKKAKAAARELKAESGLSYTAALRQTSTPASTPEPASEPDATPGPELDDGFAGRASQEPFFVQLAGRVYVSPEEWPEFSQCTARTKRGQRCKNPLDYGQSNGFSALRVPGGYVSGYNFDHNNGRPSTQSRRYLEQRCDLHFGSDAPSYADPEWEPFDEERFRDHLLSADDILARMGYRL